VSLIFVGGCSYLATSVYPQRRHTGTVYNVVTKLVTIKFNIAKYQ